MAAANLIAVWVLKPLIIALLGALQYLGLRMFSATARHVNLLMVFVLLPLSVLMALVVEPPLLIETRWLRQVNFLEWHWGWLAGYVFVACWGLAYLGLGIAVLLGRREDATMPGYTGIQAEINELRQLAGVHRTIRLQLTEVQAAPASWGVFRPVIQLPVAAAEWSMAQRKLIILHEIGHIARHDWLWLMLAQVVCCVFWVLLPVWWLNHKLNEMAERASDDWVLNLDGHSSEYAQLLLELEKQLKRNDLPVTALLGSTNFQRINALLERYSDHDICARREWSQAIVLGALVVLPLSVVGVRSADLSADYRQQSELILWPGASSEKKTTDAMWEQAATYPSYRRPSDLAEALALPDLVRPLEEVSVVAWSRAPENVDWLSAAASSEVQPVTSGTQPKLQQPAVSVRGYLPTRMVTPAYPRRAISRQLEGRVMVQFTIDIHGQVQNPQVVYAQPGGVFERAVLSALAQSRFRPPTLNGEAVELEGVSEEFIFRLQEDDSIDPRTDPPPNPSPPKAVTKIAFTY